MENKYRTLQTIAGIVSESAHPTQYQCTIREAVLHSVFDWQLIQKHLEELQEEELVILTNGEAYRFSITEKGLHKANGFDPVHEYSLRLIYSEVVEGR